MATEEIEGDELVAAPKAERAPRNRTERTAAARRTAQTLPVRRRDAQADEPADADQSPVRIRMIHGSYVGLGCPDIDDRLEDRDLGFGYTHDHPARTKFREVKGEFDPDTQQMIPSRDVFEDGEIVQLYPIPKHEEKAAETLRAADKRFSFSRREAVKAAEKLVRAGQAEHIK